MLISLIVIKILKLDVQQFFNSDNGNISSSASIHRASVDVDRSRNVLLFGVPEKNSLNETKAVVDDILVYLSGRSVNFNDHSMLFA